MFSGVGIFFMIQIRFVLNATDDFSLNAAEYHRKEFLQAQIPTKHYRQIPRPRLDLKSKEKYHALVGIYTEIKEHLSLEGEECDPILQNLWVNNFKENSLLTYLESDDWRFSICDFFGYLECVPTELMAPEIKWSKLTRLKRRKRKKIQNRLLRPRPPIPLKGRTAHRHSWLLASALDKFERWNLTVDSNSSLVPSAPGYCSCSLNTSKFQLNMMGKDVKMEDGNMIRKCFAVEGELCGWIYFEEGTFPTQNFVINDWISCYSDETHPMDCMKDKTGSFRCTHVKKIQYLDNKTDLNLASNGDVLKIVILLAFIVILVN